MIFAHLIDPPKIIRGGVSFTVNEVSLGQTVFVTDAALAKLAPDAKSDRDRVAFVMTNIPPLVEAALRKVQPYAVPELIVLEPDDVVGAI
jgi:hypothetical protein